MIDRDIQFVLNLGSRNAENNAYHFHDEQPVILNRLYKTHCMKKTHAQLRQTTFKNDFRNARNIYRVQQRQL